MKKRILTIAVTGLALVSFLSGFCAPIFAHASMYENEMNHDQKMHFSKSMEMIHEASSNGSVMPCCNAEEKKSAQNVIASSSVLTEKIQLLSNNDARLDEYWQDWKKKSINTAYLTSPPGGGLVSTTIKNE